MGSEIRECEPGIRYWLQVNESRANISAWLDTTNALHDSVVSRLLCSPSYTYLDNLVHTRRSVPSQICLGHTMKGGGVA
jgi:hypothetical protein